jgi:hypothetical protein
MDEPRIEVRPGYALITFAGPFSLDQALLQIKQISVECGRGHRSQALFDVRDVTGEFSVVSRYTLGETLAELGVIRKVAMLSRRDQTLPDNFLHVVTQNRGVHSAPFFDFSDAEAWLLSGEN